MHNCVVERGGCTVDVMNVNTKYLAETLIPGISMPTLV